MIVDHQRRFMNVLFKAEPPEADLAKLGGARERWLLYRDMVQKRMRNMIKAGLSRTAKALGDDAYDALYAAWLDDVAPRTRFIREIVPAFADFAITRWAGDETTKPWLPELARYEATRWLVGYDDVTWPTDVLDFTFERSAVTNPTLRLLRFEHRIHEPLEEGETDYEAKPTAVIVYRHAQTDKIHAWVPNALSADLIEGWMGDGGSVTDVVRSVCERRGVAIDAPFVESLGTMLAGFMDKTIVLGGR